MQREPEITLNEVETLIQGTYFAEDGGDAEEYVRDWMEREGMSREQATRAAYEEIRRFLDNPSMAT